MEARCDEVVVMQVFFVSSAGLDGASVVGCDSLWRTVVVVEVV